MIGFFRKKPKTIEAIRYTGGNYEEIQKWCKEHLIPLTDGTFLIPTLEGTMKADIGDYIIKGLKGEYYPCKPDVFRMTYDKVEDKE